MAKIKDIIARVNDAKFNNYSDSLKLRWLSLLDGQIAADVFLMSPEEVEQFSYSYPAGMEITPLVDFPYDGVYDLWLMAQIDFYNGEYEKYQNTMEMFNKAYGVFVTWFLTYYAPEKSLGKDDGDCGGGRFYYITAYGLAVKHGFNGTYEEWRDSLCGSEGGPVVSGLGEYSAQGGKNNCVLSEAAFGYGEDNVVGRLGYYYSNIDFAENKITLSTSQIEEVFEGEPLWTIGDKVSIDNGGIHPECATITAINGNVITVDKLPFAEIKQPAEMDFEDFAIYVSAKPNAGVVDFGKYAFAAGEGNQATGRSSMALGRENTVTEKYGVALGRGHVVKAYSAVATGLRNTVTPNAQNAFVSGEENTADGRNAVVLGYQSKASGQRAFAAGHKTVAGGENAVTFGEQTVASGKDAIATGSGSEASGVDSTAIGAATKAIGNRSFAQGRRSESRGDSSVAIGIECIAKGNDSFAGGEKASANQTHSFAFGYYTIADGVASVALGDRTSAAGEKSFAFGLGAKANGKLSFSAGIQTIAYEDNQIVFGMYNAYDPDALFTLGNGYVNENQATIRQNAFVITKDGNMKIGGRRVGDYVIDQGTSGVWSYRKWASGIAECWCLYSTTLSIAEQQNNIYTSEAIALPAYPFAFAEVPASFCDIRQSQTSMIWLGVRSGQNTIDPGWQRVKNTASRGAFNAEFMIYAIGKWK